MYQLYQGYKVKFTIKVLTINFSSKKSTVEYRKFLIENLSSLKFNLNKLRFYPEKIEK